MASRQSREDIEKKKERERRQKIEAVWEARRTVTVSTARIFTPAEVDAAFHGLHWEVEYQGKGKGDCGKGVHTKTQITSQQSQKWIITKIL